MEERNIHTINEVVKNNNFNAYYIIDSDKENFTTKNEIPYKKYCTKYRKLVNYSLFLYRQPKRLAKNRKFNIYGGGIIYKIEEEDNMFTAYIKDGFELVTPIMEDDDHLSNMVWTSKTKNNGWDHFWSKYGINEINEEDMLNLTEESVFVYCKDKDNILTLNNYERSIIENAKVEVNRFKDRGFSFNTDNERLRPRELVARLLVNLENEKLEFLGFEKDIRAKVLDRTERIDSGYDVLSYDENGRQMHIGVKISIHGFGGLDRVSRRELELFKDPDFYLYVVYNLDIENGNFKFDVKKGQELLEEYEFLPLLYSARIKNKKEEENK